MHKIKFASFDEYRITIVFYGEYIRDIRDIRVFHSLK